MSKKLKARKISAGGTGVYVLLRSDVLEYIVSESFKKVKPVIKKLKKDLPISPQVELPI
jgi:hypothetical protein